MTKPRSQVVDPDNPAAYHCFNRCVRGARLCGTDPLSGASRHHRRDWIERRLLDLCESFAVGLYAWAVMENHYHIVLVVDPRLPLEWSDEDVAERWCRLTQIPGTRKEPKRLVRARDTLLADPESLAEKRSRLGSLSWFMRYLNEGIARLANREDGCRGRFWESRFGCQNLLDESAMLAGMAYSDLNPIRAGMADSLADSRYTAIHRRLTAVTTDEAEPAAPLAPLAGPVTTWAPDLSVAQYIELVDWMGRQHRDGRSAIPAWAPPALASTRLSPAAWLSLSGSLQREFAASVGTRAALEARARSLGCRWLRGIGFARRLTGSA